MYTYTVLYISTVCLSRLRASGDLLHGFTELQSDLYTIYYVNVYIYITICVACRYEMYHISHKGTLYSYFFSLLSAYCMDALIWSHNRALYSVGHCKCLMLVLRAFQLAVHMWSSTKSRLQVSVHALKNVIICL